MKYLLLNIIALFSLTNLYAQKQRFVSNPEDRKYLCDKVKEIMKGIPFSDSTTQPESMYHLDTDTFELTLETKSLSQIEADDKFEELGIQIASIFWCKLLKEFPKFSFFTFTITDIHDKQLDMTYHYLGKHQLEYYSRLQQKVITVVFK